MVKNNDSITKKDLVEFGVKLGNQLEHKISIKLEGKLEEKFDIKFAEYFEIIMTSLTKTIHSSLGISKSETDKALERISYDVAVHDQQITTINQKVDSLKTKVFGL
ncbi:hypothetical protein HYV64_01090 [Candidatus Shapirobacteria bacterium]|nr:hypothetical protein [Candidatus Shapirobacteria bacterium]